MQKAEVGGAARNGAPPAAAAQLGGLEDAPHRLDPAVHRCAGFAASELVMSAQAARCRESRLPPQVIFQPAGRAGGEIGTGTPPASMMPMKP